jgi:hypothetical protein
VPRRSGVFIEFVVSRQFTCDQFRDLSNNVVIFTHQKAARMTSTATPIRKAAHVIESAASNSDKHVVRICNPLQHTLRVPQTAVHRRFGGAFGRMRTPQTIGARVATHLHGVRELRLGINVGD